MNHLNTLIQMYYDLHPINIISWQGGWSALAYKVTTDNQIYFLKMYEKSRVSTPKLTALIDHYVPVLLWLQNHSRLNGKISAPVLTKSGHYKCEDDQGIYLLYEYIEGKTIGDQNLSTDQVHQLSEIISELHLHGEDLPFNIETIREDFGCLSYRRYKVLFIKINSRCKMPDDVYALIQQHADELGGLIHNVQNLADDLRKQHVPMALCHTDLHHWNLMQTEHQLILIDWEGLKLAPVEADLMFLVDKPYFDEFLSIYRQYHPHFQINHDVLRFYQIKRKLEDIWELMEQLIFDQQEPKERARILHYLIDELNSTMG